MFSWVNRLPYVLLVDVDERYYLEKRKQSYFIDCEVFFSLQLKTEFTHISRFSEVKRAAWMPGVKYCYLQEQHLFFWALQKTKRINPCS